MLRTLTLLIVAALAAPLAAGEPADVPAEAVEQAEINLLRRTVERQKQEIAELRQQLATLTEQIQSLGVTPATAENAADAPPRLSNRIVFIRTSGDQKSYEALIAAVCELEPHQHFNFLRPDNSNKTITFEPRLVPATDLNKQRFEKYLANYDIIPGTWLEAIAAAGKWRPDVIWLVGTVRGDEEEVVAQIKQKLRGTHTRINTSKVFAQSVEGAHLLWRIAHETGGVCVDDSGEPISEPAVPIKAEPKPREPPKSILRETRP